MFTSKLAQKDSWLKPYESRIVKRHDNIEKREKELTQGKGLADFATGYLFFGLHKVKKGWVFREWAPNATEVFLVGDFSGWKQDPKYAMKKKDFGTWEITPVSYTHLDVYKRQRYTRDECP